MTQNSFALAVLGMHRSGTSALTGSLGHLGVDLGDEMRAPHRGVNEKGYWEHLGILRVHERILADLGSSWDDVRPLPDGWWMSARLADDRNAIVEILRRDFSGKPFWGVKDPRLCRLVPLWRDIFSELGCRSGYVMTYRSPVEVARSLAKRDGFTTEKSALIWLENNLAAERSTRGASRVFIGFDGLLANPRATFSHIENVLEVRLPKRFDDAAETLREFLTPQLRHHDGAERPAEIRFGSAHDLVRDVEAALRESCLGETDATRAQWEDLGRRYATHVANYEAAITSHLSDLQERVRELQRSLEDVTSSASWQVFRPLRKMERLVSRAFEKV